MFRKSMVFLACAGTVLFLLPARFAGPPTRIFGSYEEALAAMTARDFRMYAAAFLLMGFNVWGAAFFPR